MAEAEAQQAMVVTREELYRQVWETPMSRLALRYGITGNGLAKICDRLRVPYPPRGYWARKAAGQNVTTYRLLAAHDVPKDATIVPTPPKLKPKLPTADSREQPDKEYRDAVSVTVADRLVRPHPVIAGWIEKYQRAKAGAKGEYDPLRKRFVGPAEHREINRRRYRILDAIFKALERQGGKIKEEDRKGVFVELNGECIEIQLREKYKQVRRPLTGREKQ